MKFSVKVVLLAVVLVLNVGFCRAGPVQSVPGSVAGSVAKPAAVPRSNFVVIPSRSIFVAPIVCPEGQKADRNGKCRDVW